MYIVTGGAGFIGSAFVWRLNQLGVEDIIVVDNLGHSSKWRNLVNRTYTEYLHKTKFLEMLQSKELPWFVEGIVHLGACSSTTETDADYLMENNYRYSRQLCELAMENGVRFVNASSAATYGDGKDGFSDDLEAMLKLKPLNMYGYSKHLFDLWAHREGVLDQIVSLKFFNVFGPNEYHKADMTSVVCKAHEQIRATGKLKLFKSYLPEYLDGGQKRDFVYVKDCVNLIWWFLENPEANGVFNVGAGQARTWNELAAAVFDAMNAPQSIEYIDMPEILRGKYQYFTQSDLSKLRAAGYAAEFISLEDAVCDYVVKYLAAEDRYL